MRGWFAQKIGTGVDKNGVLKQRGCLTGPWWGRSFTQKKINRGLYKQNPCIKKINQGWHLMIVVHQGVSMICNLHIAWNNHFWSQRYNTLTSLTVKKNQKIRGGISWVVHLGISLICNFQIAWNNHFWSQRYNNWWLWQWKTHTPWQPY